jgi:arylsulfatase A-like enzyme
VAQALQSQNSASIDAVYFKSQSGSAWTYAAQYLNPGMTPAFAHACSYLLSTAASRSSPDVVVVYRPYAGLAPAGKTGATTGFIGPTWPIQHVPLILSGHGAYAGRTSTYPARLVDIAPTLESALGLPVVSHDGIVLRDALYNSASSNVAQTSGRAKLSPLTAALRNRAGNPPR